MATYRNFACPDCLRLTTKPWREVWCANDPAYALQGYDPNDESDIRWTKMVELPKSDLRALIDVILGKKPKLAVGHVWALADRIYKSGMLKKESDKLR